MTLRMTGSATEALAPHGQDFRAQTGDVFPGPFGISGAFHPGWLNHDIRRLSV